VQRIARLHERRDEIADEIAGIYAEAKHEGFDPNELRALAAAAYRIRRQGDHQ
jgi:uncharacterized protein (UPF0335 family)